MGCFESNIRTSFHFRKHPLAFTWSLGCLKRPPDKVFLDLTAFTKFCRCCWEFVNASFFVGAARFWYSGNLPAPTKCRCSKILLVYKIFLHLHFVGAGRFFCRCSNILIEWESCCTYINFCRYLHIRCSKTSRVSDLTWTRLVAIWSSRPPLPTMLTARRWGQWLLLTSSWWQLAQTRMSRSSTYETALNMETWHTGKGCLQLFIFLLVFFIEFVLIEKTCTCY